MTLPVFYTSMKDAEVFGRSSDGTVRVLNLSSSGEVRMVFGGDTNPSVSVSGITGTTIAVGDTVSDAVDTGEAPVKIGGIARTGNPTAVAAGDRVSATFDDVGRQVMALYQVRDLLATALASTVTTVEVQLLAGVAGVFHDLLEVTAANTTAAARTVDIRDTAGSGAVVTIAIPANSSITQQFPATKPQNEAGNAWTIINTTPGVVDASNDNIIVSATFVKNV